MKKELNKHVIILRLFSIVAILFGMLTIKSGGMVLFTEGAAHQAAGNYVPFVLWFNFIAGFAYVAAGIGLWQQWDYSRYLAASIAVATVVVFIALGVHILNNGAYEIRTVVAMSARSTIWTVIALVAFFMGRRGKLNGTLV